MLSERPFALPSSSRTALLIAESAVHAVPSELGEDDIKACVVAQRPIQPRELLDYLRANPPYLAIPRCVEFLDALPRNGVGGVMKHKLREATITPDAGDFEAMALSVTKEERR